LYGNETNQNQQKEERMSNKETTKRPVQMGIDLAKNVFQLYGVDKYGKKCLSMKVSRKNLLAYTQQLPPCLIGMEACSGSHYWARAFKAQGHDARLMAAQHVKPYRKSIHKDDKIDAESICEAVGRPTMLFVPIKPHDQLDVQAIHRARQQLMKSQNVLANQMRGFLIEYGICIPKGVSHVYRQVPLIIEDADNTLSLTMRDLLHGLYEQLKIIKERIKAFNEQLQTICKNNTICQRAEKVPGIGPVTATALFAAIGKGDQFKNGREAAAWLGMVPYHKGTGGKTYVIKMSKRGNRYLKSIAIQGGRALVLACQKRDDKYSIYVNQLRERKGYNVAAVACAHRAIRVAWAVMRNDEEYRMAA
jgi:transposase